MKICFKRKINCPSEIILCIFIYGMKLNYELGLVCILELCGTHACEPELVSKLVLVCVQEQDGKKERAYELELEWRIPY